jgi:autotransporter-associated beta strand protein
MNKLFALAIGSGLSLVLLLPDLAQAGSATWELNPTSGDWNTAANWTPMTVPNGSADTATFGLSNTTNVSISANTEVNGITFTSAATNPYTITVSPDVTLTVSGAGITNNSGTGQFFETAANQTKGGTIIFANSATAGTTGINSNEGGSVVFADNSTAANAGISANDGGSVVFTDNSTAGSAGISCNQGFATFTDNSTAGSAGISVDGLLKFLNNSSADHAFIVPLTAAGFVSFGDNATAGNATFSYGDLTGVEFRGSSSAGAATFSNSGGDLFFFDDSQGGTAQIQIRDLGHGPGFLDISQHNPGSVTVGSIEGNGTVLLGANNLIVGSNNLSTVMTGGLFGAAGISGTGSLIKVGTGTLEFAAGDPLSLENGNNDYTGGTIVTAGTLLVNNISGSGTGTGAVQVTGGTLGGTGTIAGTVTVGTGTGAGAFISPGASPGTLTIQSSLTLNSDATYQFELNSTIGDADKIIANGVTLNGAAFSFTDLGSGELPVGTTFVVIDNTSSAAISGIFSNLTDKSEFSNNGNTYEVSYEGGTGNDLTLTVTPGNVSVPDHASTLLLLTFSLLGLVTSRWRLLVS